ncbi:MAG TPA: TIM44-like domain-containing protein [Pyrinomonadaceae bacterium]|nr:TIM44-like domain-containing protein [Pyrinomonadaceae bacterium]
MNFKLLKFIFRASAVAATCGWLLLFPIEILARVGGGQSYGGGSRGSGGGGGDGDGGALAWLIFEAVRFLIYLTFEHPVIGIPLDIIVLLGVVYFFRRRKKVVSFSSIVPPVAEHARPNEAERSLERLRKFDPNFSQIVFTDFVYALYAKAHDARGHGATALDLFSPYLSEAARKTLLSRNPSGLREVTGVIVGSMRPVQVVGLESPVVKVGLVFEANYTEVTGDGRSMTYYVTERWNLERKRDLLSPPPAQATALHCPRCGAPLQRDSVGACAYCGTRIESGEFQWFVQNITLLSTEARGPMLTSDVEEVGTDFPSVVQPNFSTLAADFTQRNPQFSWADFQARAKLIFDELQAAWSTLNWERARPHETDNIFQMHQYWIEAYRRQGLRNVVENCVITGMQPVKIQDDAFYQAITLRIWAKGNDYTVDNNENVVSGSRTRTREWSEYWTFIRNREAKDSRVRTELSCPNCASPLKVNASGICEFCGGKITSGEFDWVLSKIEQDESYAG